MKKQTNKSIGSNAGRNRNHNRRVILEYVRANEPAGCAEIARSCGLSIQAVSNIISSLENDGLLTNIGSEKGKRGKPVVQYKFNSQSTFSIGIELRPDTLFCAALNLNGTVIHENSISLDDATPDKAIPAICNMVNNTIFAIKRNRKQLLGVGITMPGPFGVLTNSDLDQANLPRWDNVNIKLLLEAALKCPIIVENDANAVAISERIARKETKLNNFCYIYFGTGLGLGVIIDGQAQHGAFGNFGEIGHIPTQIGGNSCGCGNQGCLETYVSTLSLKTHLEAMQIEQVNETALDILFNNQDQRLMVWIDQAAKHLSQAINIIENIFDPETVIIGGAINKNIINAIIERLNLPISSISNRRQRLMARVMRGTTGPFTAAIGGAAMIIHNTTTPFSPNIIERNNMTLTDVEKLQIQHSNPRVLDLWKALQPLKSCLSFMNTGAHPDDETTPMLTALGLRDGAKLSHACANRGEGGQNIIGREIAKDLGAVRTREMERAAQVINMTHYWLSKSSDDQIYDFGFSKSGSETLNIWGEARTLERFVLIIRRERPDIICPTFLDISGQHGHHQAMTRSAFKAVLMAADPQAFPEQLNNDKYNLDIWQVKKIYLPAWSGAGDAYDDDVPPPPATTQIDATGADPVLGMDYAQIAQYSRSFHRTQGMGQWVEPGAPSIWPLNLAWSFNGKPANEASIFENLPHNLSQLADYANAPSLKADLTKAQKALDAAITAWPDNQTIKTKAMLANALIHKIIEQCPPANKAEILHRLYDKQKQLAKLLLIANNIQYALSPSQTEVNAGGQFSLTLSLHAPNIDVKPELNLPTGWQIIAKDDNVYTISVPSDAAPSDPFPDTWYPDQANDKLHLKLSWQDAGQDINISVDLEERIQILPAFSANLSQTAAIINLSNPQPIELEVSNIHPQNGSIMLQAGDGWQIESSSSTITLTPTDTLKAGSYDIPLTVNGQKAKLINRMKYPHIGATNRCVDAILKIRVMDVTLPKGKIAYIGGGNDRTDFWLKKIGIKVHSLSNKAVANVNFDQYDTILVGIFGFSTCPNLSKRLTQLHAWVKDGGNLVTLYHRPWDNWNVEKTPLAPMQIGKPSLRWRVTDQNATVKILQPQNALFNIPNKISNDDWSHWDKERGLYFAASWDDAYTPLLSMADPNEAPLTGSLLTGNFGKGRHTHTSLILHHQVEKLVPGGYRLLANLLNNDR